MQSGDIVGYVKGGPLENYQLRRGTHDENLGKNNTAYMEYMSIRPGYWGATGGHLLRLEFLKHSRHRDYSLCNQLCTPPSDSSQDRGRRRYRNRAEIRSRQARLL